ncbi:MAG: glutamine-hydrolyzing carbamoyl-phosphate synthase small subunit [Bacillota bacterium]
MRGRLVLEDGTVYEGRAFGRPGTAFGEVVFNTGMTGYQEVLTDPSYCGQIVTMTYPLIGNTGICEGDSQSHRPFVRGLVVHQLCATPSHTRMIGRLDDYLYGHGILALEGVDTRALTRKLRVHGTMNGAITSGDAPGEELVRQLSCQGPSDLVAEVATGRPWRVFGDGPHLVVVDLGVKLNLIRYFSRHNCTVTVVPPTTPAEDILDMDPAGVLFSNGPGDPADAHAAIGTARELLGKTRLFGICLGHQVLALAMGARTFKLKYGHRGGNHPVRDLRTNHVQMTAQNHGYAVVRESLAGLGVDITHTHLHDATVEGLSHRRLPVNTLQYHPEVGPGPNDSEHLLAAFLTSLGGQAPAQKAPEFPAALAYQGE